MDYYFIEQEAAYRREEIQKAVAINRLCKEASSAKSGNIARKGESFTSRLMAFLKPAGFQQQAAPLDRI